MVRRAYHLPVASGADPEIDSLYLDLAKQLYNGHIPDGIDPATTIASAKDLMKGVFKGFGGQFSAFKYDSPDYNKLAALERSVYQFAGAKNWQMLKDLTGALKEGNRALPFQEWEPKAKNIIGSDYEGRYKRIEYNTSVSSSQMASKCVEYDQHPDDLVEYIDAQDDRECPICRGYRGIILPWSHPFWRTACPLNHFGCHCSTRRLNSGKRTPESEIPGFDKIPAMFRQNIAEKGLVFPEEHAYFIGCPKNILDQAMGLMPYERRFEPIYQSRSRSKLGHPHMVFRHVDVDTDAPDYTLQEVIAREKADMGHTVNIMPEVHVNEVDTRNAMFPGVIGAKNPDMRIDGELVEIKGLKSGKERAIKTKTREAGGQAHHVIINIPEEVPEALLKKIATRRFSDNKTLQIIEYRLDGKYYTYKQKG